MLTLDAEYYYLLDLSYLSLSLKISGFILPFDLNNSARCVLMRDHDWPMITSELYDRVGI